MSLQIWLPMTTSTTNNCGIYHTKITNQEAKILTSGGKIAQKCVTFSEGNYIALDDTDKNIISPEGKQMSFAFWMKTTHTASNMCLFCNRTATGEGISLFKLDSATKPIFRFDAGAQTQFDCAATYGNWTHFCFTWDGKTKRFYVNGELKASKNCTANVSKYGTKMLIGSSASNTSSLSGLGNRFIGQLTDYRIYNHCLSLKEIKDISRGLILHFPLNGLEKSNILLGDSYKFSGVGGSGITITDYAFPYRSYENTSASDYKELCSWNGTCTVNANEVYTASFIARSSKSSKMTVYFWNNNSGVQVKNITSSQNHNKGGGDGNCELTLTPKWQQYWITWRFNGTTTPLSKNLLFRLWPGAQADIALVKLEKGDKATPYTIEKNTNTTINDISGYKHNGTSSAILALSSDTAHNGNSRVFDSNKYITATHTPCGDNVSAACWVKLNSYPTSHAIVFADQATKLSFGFYNSGAIISCGSETNTTRTVTGLKDKWDLTKWHHIAVVKSGTTYTFYFDGQEWTSYGSNNYWTQSPANTLVIGARNRNGTLEHYFTGQLSDFRIYATALPAAAVQSIANASQIIDTHGTDNVFFVNETNNERSQIMPGGIQKMNFLSEIIELEDGSSWIQLSNHNNHGGTNPFPQFSSTVDFSKNFIYNNDECWAAFHLINDSSLRYSDNYEFMSIENVGNTNSIIRRRWSQTKNPFTATFDEVKPVANNTNGFYALENMPEEHGGLMRSAKDRACFKLANSNNSTWWYGAFGCSYNQAYGAGLPTARDNGVEFTTGGLFNLYMRIKPDAFKYREFNKGIVMPTTINEI